MIKMVRHLYKLTRDGKTFWLEAHAMRKIARHIVGGDKVLEEMGL